MHLAYLGPSLRFTRKGRCGEQFDDWHWGGGRRPALPNLPKVDEVVLP